MLGGKNTKPLGYTIVEVMIVLAISGVMFLIAAEFISGKQEKTSFVTGVHQMASEVQDVIEQVTDGRYSDVALNCRAGLPGQPPTISSAVTPHQGTDQECVFRGKLIHFYESGSSLPEDYEVISLADLSTAVTGGPNTITGIKGLTTQSEIPQQLDLSKLYINGIPSLGYSLGFVQSLGAADQSTPGAYLPGAQTINIIHDRTLPVTSIYQSETQVGGNTQAATSATICLTDGKQFATIDVGATNNNQLSVNVTMDGAMAC